jgi:type III pantothenate kinase
MTVGALLAIDVGSSRVKLGWFASAGDCVAANSPSAANPLAITTSRLRPPDEAVAVAHRGRPAEQWWDEVHDWLQSLVESPPPGDAFEVRIASVHPQVAQTICGSLGRIGWPLPTVLTHEQVPVVADVDRPERVGIDRLLDAHAVNQLRAAGAPAIVVDLGTAVTVDRIDGGGHLAGGAILPGLALAALALHTGTASLPALDIDTAVPTGLGKSTDEAIAAGVLWGTVGGVAELVRRLADDAAQQGLGECELFVTGGDAPRLIDALANAQPMPIRHVPHLVLCGIHEIARQGGACDGRA